MGRHALTHPDHSISKLLVEVSRGNRDAETALMTQVYNELRRLARRYMRAERANHTLQPTALVNEAPSPHRNAREPTLDA